MSGFKYYAKRLEDGAVGLLVHHREDCFLFCHNSYLRGKSWVAGTHSHEVADIVKAEGFGYGYSHGTEDLGLFEMFSMENV
ncbi:hypothetical protein, partial [Bacillus cereus group sp. Bce002]|uniref:hypothetical protein n=1 Tax=Bacillus cereus group sp. Bce002 TaxID=3445259 RepID=UPI003F2748FB